MAGENGTFTAEEVHTRLMEFMLDYEKRHSDLKERVVRLEVGFSNLATHDDLSRLKNEIITELSKMIPTATDVDWLKRWFWLLASAVVGLGITVLGMAAAILLKIAGKI